MTRIINHSKLDEILNWANNYQDDQLFVGISSFNIEKIIKVKNCLIIQNSVIDVYISELEYFSKSFTEEYATNDNNCFKDDEERFKRLKTCYYFVRDFVLSCCPRSPYSAYNYKHEHVKYNDTAHSYICTDGEYQLDCFGKESYPKPVQELCEEFDKLFNKIRYADDLCQSVIEAEKRIRSNPIICKELYNEAYEEEADICFDAVKMLNKCDVKFEKDKFEEAKDQGITGDEIYPSLYHKLNKREFHTHVLIKELEIARSQGLQDEEKVLFPNMLLEQVLEKRFVAQNFHKVAYANRGITLASECIAFLIGWYGTNEGKIKLCYDYIKNNYSGELDFPSYKAVSRMYKSKLGRGNRSARDKYGVFSAKFDALKKQYNPLGKVKRTSTPLSSYDFMGLS